MNKKQSPVKSILKELVQPFGDIFRTSRALLGVNLSYIIEGLTYFGIVGLLTIFFNDNIGLSDEVAGYMVGVLTAGITLAMLFLGATVDWVGVRKAFLISLSLMLVGRLVITLAPSFGGGIWSVAHWMSIFGMLGIVLGYGIYQPAAYAAVKKFTNAKTSAMGYAMLYALMNLGGFLPGVISPPIRKQFGITGVFWVFVALTVVGMLLVTILITKKAERDAAAEAKLNAVDDLEEEKDELEEMTGKEKFAYYMKNFPLKDLRFLFFIFALIPVQTLFAHNWLTLPAYTSRAFDGFVQENFEFFVNLNPILIFVLTPIVTALTVKKNTYSMMIIGTLIMSLPTFILVLGPNINTLMAYLVLMTIGEAMWQPRFLQWVADIAPKGMTGIYMGIGQFPWFLTKMVTAAYSGWFLSRYCPADMPQSSLNTEHMWLIYSFIAISSTVMLLIARKWMMKGFKVKNENSVGA